MVVVVVAVVFSTYPSYVKMVDSSHGLLILSPVQEHSQNIGLRLGFKNDAYSKIIFVEAGSSSIHPCYDVLGRVLVFQSLCSG